VVIKDSALAAVVVLGVELPVWIVSRVVLARYCGQSVLGHSVVIFLNGLSAGAFASIRVLLWRVGAECVLLVGDAWHQREVVVDVKLLVGVQFGTV